MLKRFIAWIRGSHHTRSVGILKSFSNINAQLQELNNDITQAHIKNSQKIQDLQEKNILLMQTFSKNSNVAGNIAKLLGEE